MDITIDSSTGKVSFNLIDLFAQLDDEKEQEIVEALAWVSPMWDELKRVVLQEYANTNYNDSIWKIRLAFLTGEGADERVRDVVGKLIGLWKLEKQRASQWQDTYYAFYRWWIENREERFPISAPGWKPHPPVTQAEIDEVLREGKE